MLPGPGFAKHALWFYGVLVGLAIKEAVTRVAPHLLTFEADAGFAAMAPESWRLIVFVLMILRFYLGAAHQFDTVHPAALRQYEQGPLSEEDTKQQRAARVRLGVDFFSGLLHFLIFAGWSLTLEIHHLDRASTEPIPSEWVFRWVLLFILAYDFFWLLGRPRPHDTLVKVWTAINITSAIIASAIFIWLWRGSGWMPMEAEAPALLFLTVVSLVDIIGLAYGVEFFTWSASFACHAADRVLRRTAERFGNWGRKLDPTKKDGQPQT